MKRQVKIMNAMHFNCVIKNKNYFQKEVCEILTQMHLHHFKGLKIHMQVKTYNLMYKKHVSAC